MTRTHARAPQGKRAVDSVPRNRGTVTTILGSLSAKGIEGVMTVSGGTDKAVFSTFVQEILAPKLEKGDVVVLDNLGAHRTEQVKTIIEAKGASILFLPPYHPEMNPIEMAWSKIKQKMRSIGARTVDALNTAVAQACDTITEQNAKSWIGHAGYQVN